MPTHHTFLL